ncbi:Histidine kinase [Flexibacter flexilis DSM 6793]|uniref:Histidine kinase n=2 Tax=Flexibacter flexilis TaxID=998 RepID=A0A1I1ITG4_9BACT|nr:Histidine kinase [Flexibacter flexilis DSM 6793]
MYTLQYAFEAFAHIINTVCAIKIDFPHQIKLFCNMKIGHSIFFPRREHQVFVPTFSKRCPHSHTLLTTWRPVKAPNRYQIIVGYGIISGLMRYFMFPQYAIELHLLVFAVFTVGLTITWDMVRLLSEYLDKKMPYERGIMQRVVLQISISLLFTIFFRKLWVALMVHLFPHEFNIPILKHIIFFIDILITLVINANYISLYFFREWKKSAVQAERLQKERAQVQFDNLKNQLNPHFLFNSLTSLNSLIFDNQQLASDFLKHLSRVYRYVLQTKDRELVSLSTELDFISNYVFLLKTRFEEMLRIDFDVPEDQLEKQIAPVTLQILIENAIKHNIISESKHLRIHIYIQNDYLVVENNLQRKTLVEDSNKTGLENMQNLYSFYSADRKVLIEETATSFAVKLPLL